MQSYKSYIEQLKNWGINFEQPEDQNRSLAIAGSNKYASLKFIY